MKMSGHNKKIMLKNTNYINIKDFNPCNRYLTSTAYAIILIMKDKNSGYMLFKSTNLDGLNLLEGDL